MNSRPVQAGQWSGLCERGGSQKLVKVKQQNRAFSCPSWIFLDDFTQHWQMHGSRSTHRTLPRLAIVSVINSGIPHGK